MEVPGPLAGQAFPGERYRFGDIEVDPAAHTLTRAGAAVPGEFRVLPARAEMLYFREVWGRSAGTHFTVTE